MDNLASGAKPSDGQSSLSEKRNARGIVLIPQPSDNLADPHNWHNARKFRMLAILCLAAFSGTAGALAGQLAFAVQAKVYKKTTLELSYSSSAAYAGIAGGPLILAPLVYIVGRPSMIFWSLLGSLACAVWSARLTGSADYIPFVMSRLLSGIFGSVPVNVGSSMILDIFFLHQRGKAFLCYSLSTALGVLAAPTFGGFILTNRSWTVLFWWTVPLLGITAIFVILFLEETRHMNENVTVTRSKTTYWGRYLYSRVITFLPGSAVSPHISPKQFVKHTTAPVLIGLSPAAGLAGLFIMIFFGWVLLLNVISPVLLERSVEEGGYGFTSAQTAAFTFSQWIGLFLAQAVGILYNDRFPLFICKRFKKGVWAPELRLYCLIIPILCLPIGLGISAAALQYHYHYMVLALGVFMSLFAGLLAQPIIVNYVVECYTDYAVESSIIVAVYRLGWGIAITFFVGQWENRIDVGWVFGMSAFFALASGFLILILIWKGHVLRRWSLVKSLISTEAGREVL